MLSLGSASRPLAHDMRRVLRSLSSSFYDSQSGQRVNVPTGVQLHVGMSTVPIDRIPSALQHLLKPDRKKLIRGVASVMNPVVKDERGIAAVKNSGADEVCIAIHDMDAGLIAVKAATSLSLRPRALLEPALCIDPHELQLHAANLGDAGAEAIIVAVDTIDEDSLREIVDLACEVDLLGIPMRSRLGLRIKPSASALELATFAHKELELLHFVGCLAGKQAPKPSDLLSAVGVRRADADFGKLFLAEFVPDAA